jgi:hypothetical protein
LRHLPNKPTQTECTQAPASKPPPSPSTNQYLIAGLDRLVSACSRFLRVEDPAEE